jgi:pyrroloquinoline quinone biosynthesis protein D
MNAFAGARVNTAGAASDFDATAVPALRRGVRLARDTPHGAMLLAPERGYLLNDTAHAVVALIDGVRSIADIAALLSRKYAAREVALRADALALVRELAARRLLTRAAAPAEVQP